MALLLPLQGARPEDLPPGVLQRVATLMQGEEGLMVQVGPLTQDPLSDSKCSPDCRTVLCLERPWELGSGIP
jgi:hypothetical protein